MRTIAFRFLPCALVAAVLFLFGAPSLRAGEDGQAEFAKFLVSKKIAKVCLDVLMDDQGAMTVARSSGDTKIDRKALDLLQGSNTIADMARKSRQGVDGKKRLPLSFDHTAIFPKGKIYCPAESAPSDPK